MATITPKTIYPYKGKDYKNLKDLRTQIENEIGKIIDKLNRRLAPKEALDLLNIIIANKSELVELLSVEVDLESDNLHGHFENILDIDV